MKFRQHQEQAQAQTFKLFAWFAVLLAGLVLAINGLLALAYKLLMPLSHGYPALFFETNSAVVLLFVLGGCVIETQRLREGGGQRVAHWMHGRLVKDPDDALEKRLLNVVDEMAMASGQTVPHVYVLTREDAINAFVAGWSPEDYTLCVTRGALDRLTRAELQGLVAHEFGHLKEEDLPLAMRLLALVWGLSLVHGYGQTLMSPDDNGHVNPVRWLIGIVFSVVGWMGWGAGRLLQAAVARQREFLADANAIQFTRTRDGLGNVLRKIWFDQKMMAGQMRHPQADMVASLLLHQSKLSRCMATHPRLPERIRRICGAVLGPMPAPLLRLEKAEPRRHPTVAPEGVMLAAATTSPSQAPPLPAPPDDTDCIGRLRRLAGPREKRMAVLALMMSAGNRDEHKLWLRLAEGLTHAQQILDDVQGLSAGRLVPEFERLCKSIAGDPISDRRALVEAARDLLKADGRVSPRDRLWWLALRHHMSDKKNNRPFMRPVTGQGRELADLQEDELAHVIALTAYLARFVPEVEVQGLLAATSRAWYARVMARCAPSRDFKPDGLIPDADALMHALAGVQELSWMIRPVLLRAWVEEALNHSPGGLMSHDTANALRLMASLIDSPMPPALASHYPRD
ncbi:M48 family metalloprotease [Aquabacterium sp.]|uniref:M48 family metalloprotease n=1 Tax=Aquabacterium sp. TaxID=1872578 RepID=UPI003D6C9097